MWRTPKKQSGAGLIEVMVAVLILGIGLLGIAAMQATALKNSQSSLERSQAVIQSYTILDAMRANRDVALIGGYNLAAMTCNPPDAGTLAGTDLHNWINSLHATLGATSCGQIICGTELCSITVRWDDSRGVGGGEEHEVTTETRL